MYRPYLLVQLRFGDTLSPQVPMIVDTGADACYIDHNLAYTIGINPFDGRSMGEVQGISESNPTAQYPVQLCFPQIGIEINVPVKFTRVEHGLNGLLGHAGFLDQFERISFFPGKRFFELVPLTTL